MDREAYVVEMSREGDKQDVAAIRRVFAWADDHRLKDTFEPASAHGHIYAPVIKGVEWEPIPFATGTTPPRLFVSGESLRSHHPFKLDVRWQQVLDRLYALPQVVQTEKGFYPNILLRDLAEEGTWNEVFGVLAWVVQSVRSSAAKGLL